MTDQLKTQAISGVKWNTAAMVVLTGLQFVTMAVLARLLTPSDFGLMGIVMIVIGFAQAFVDMGLSNAIIQRQQVEETHLSSFFWINIFLGSGLFICILAITPLVVLYFKQPSISTYLVLMALSFLIAPVGQIFRTLLRKELKFKTLSQIEIAESLVYSLSAIGLAVMKLGVLSLIFGQLISHLFAVIVLFWSFRTTWRPRFYFDFNAIRSYLRFGLFQTGERAVNYLSANVDYIIIGRFLGAEALGFYTLAYQIIIFPLTKINPIITKVAFPVFSKIQHDHAHLRQGYCNVLHFITLLSFPMLAGMGAVAPEFINSVYGPQWEPAILPLQLLCLVGIFKSLGNPVGSILLAKGRADIGFYWNVFVVIMVSIAVLVGSHWGIIGVAAALFTLQFPLFGIIQPIVNRLIELTFSQYLQAIRFPLICSLIMFAGVVVIKTLLHAITALPLLLVSVTIGVALYTISYYLHDPTIFVELHSLLRGN